MPQLVRKPVPAASKLDAALKLHAAGWWVVPQAGKIAVVPGWDQYRLSEDDLREYLSDGRFNIAVVLSQSPVVDVECDGSEAEAVFLSAVGGIAPRTPTWRSRRGLHRLFLRPDPAPDRAVVHVNGIEFRLGCRPALSTVPPSIHPEDGTVYRWLPGRSLNECQPIPLPDALAKMLQKAPKGRATPTSETGGVVITEGMRNDTLFRYGCRMARSIGMEDVGNNIHGANKLVCKPPLSDDEVAKIVESVKETSERGKTSIMPIRCWSWSEVVDAWRNALEWGPDLENILAVMLAVAASTSQTGDQLFLQVVGAPGTAKTRFCDAMLVSPSCKRLDKLTGFFSGKLDYDDPSKDYSFINRANHKTLITAEADILMSSPGWSELMSQQRRIFDGSASASYKNRDEDLVYTGLRTPWIMAGTPAMIDKDQSHLGDRFLRVRMPKATEEMKQRILARVGLSALDAVCQESNCSPESVLTPEMLRAYQLTGGYIDWLRNNITPRVRAVRAATDVQTLLERCTMLADYTAYMRSRPPTKLTTIEPDYEPVIELPSRLKSQFTRLSMCLAVVMQHSKVDQYIHSIVRRVALDTSYGRTQSLCRMLARAGREGTVPTEIALRSKESEDRVVRWLGHMDRVGAVVGWAPLTNGVQSLKRWRLTDRLAWLYREVTNAQS